jgi:hypothetical protein
MSASLPAKKNAAFTFWISLRQQADTRLVQSSPTLAAADFNVSTDGGALAALGTTPTVTPAAGRLVKISLSAGEMNGDDIMVVCSDSVGAQWCDLTIWIKTSTRQTDDLAFPATSGRSMVVDAAGLVDANAVKVGPTGAGTAQTAGDLKASIDTVDNFVDTEIADIQARLPAVLVGGRMDSSVGAMAANVVTAAAIADGAIDNATFAADVDTYQAKVTITDDDGGTSDRYAVAWFKNGQPIVAGITVPLIQVYKIADGADLVAETAMAEIAATQTFRYVEGANRLVDGVGYIAKATATIGGSARTWYQPVSRDS